MTKGGRRTRGRSSPLAALIVPLLLAAPPCAVSSPLVFQYDGQLIFGRGRSASMREAYGSGIGCGASVSVLLHDTWSVHCSGAWLRQVARVDAPSFTDDARGTLSQWPLTLGLRYTLPSGRWRPSVELGGGILVARESFRYTLLARRRDAGATHLFPALLAGAGVETRSGGWVWRAGLRAVVTRDVRHLLRPGGRLDETSGSGAAGLLVCVISLGRRGGAE